MDQRVERERKTKKYIFNSKNNFPKGSFNCNAHKKSAVTFGTPTLLPFYPQTSNFGPSKPHSWTPLLAFYTPPWVISEFPQKL